MKVKSEELLAEDPQDCPSFFQQNKQKEIFFLKLYYFSIQCKEKKVSFMYFKAKKNDSTDLEYYARSWSLFESDSNKI